MSGRLPLTARVPAASPVFKNSRRVNWDIEFLHEAPMRGMLSELEGCPGWICLDSKQYWVWCPTRFLCRENREQSSEFTQQPLVAPSLPIPDRNENYDNGAPESVFQRRPLASPAIQRSQPDKASKTERWRGFSIPWFMGGMLLILASWIWHFLVTMGLASIVISLVLEQYQ